MENDEGAKVVSTQLRQQDTPTDPTFSVFFMIIMSPRILNISLFSLYYIYEKFCFCLERKMPFEELAFDHKIKVVPHIRKLRVYEIPDSLPNFLKTSTILAYSDTSLETFLSNLKYQRNLNNKRVKENQYHRIEYQDQYRTEISTQDYFNGKEKGEIITPDMNNFIQKDSFFFLSSLFYVKQRYNQINKEHPRELD